ncbi:hypothetical protein FSP39_009500 [Pinctada imbricata]|uniref:SET domain-containing protein n=1 Tax=Pinctada imbricata TaxID=66713 RepID=A0AA88Y601_PINIB|nr:hypothetical protein FSP39_009500 [Pinctada imbricata]
MRQTRKKPEGVAREYISSSQDPSGFRVEIIPPKCLGIITKIRRNKGEYLLCYHGNLIILKEGEELEDIIPSTFRYFFSWQQKDLCVDATEKTNKFGRLVNHGRREKNSVMKTIECEGKLYLCLFAAKDILPQEEILYDYGISNLPWEIGSKTNR